MSVGIPLIQTPNQSLTVTLDGVLFALSIKATNGCMCVSVTANGTDIVVNARAVACAPIIPEPYQEHGNFLFLTANNQLPNYEQFGLTQSLIYLTEDELAAFRVPPVAANPGVPTVTPTSFNPAGGLPLRFAPIGYVEG